MMDTPAQKLGQELEAKREQLGLTLQNVAEHTRIRKVYLESMEKGQLEDLPGQAYVTGFVRVYARYLGLNSDDLLLLLEAPWETGSTQSANSAEVKTNPVAFETQARAGSGWGAFVLGFIIVIVLGSLFYFLLLSFDSSDSLQNPDHDLVGSRQATTARPGEVAVVAGTSSLGNHSAQDSFPVVPREGTTLRMLALAESSLIIYLDDRRLIEQKLTEGLELSWEVKKSIRIELAEAGVARFWLGSQELNLQELQAFELNTAPGE